MLKIKELSHYYPPRTKSGSGKRSLDHQIGELALNNINLEISKGERLVLLGSSGAGKSTLLRCANRTVMPTKGKIFIDDVEITELSSTETQKIRRQIGVISQQFNLVEGASALKNVLYGRLGYISTIRSVLGWFTEEDRTIAADSLHRVGLRKYAHKRVTDLSGGQRQRVAIARCLAQNPDILLADEPVSSLDPKLMADIMDLIQQLCVEDGITLIASLHFLELAKTYASRFVGIRSGEVVFDDLPHKMTDKDIVDIYGETEDWILYGRTGY